MAEETLPEELAVGHDPLTEPPPRRLVLDMPSWLPIEKVPRWLLLGLGLLALVALVLGTTVPFGLGWLSQDDLKTLGYPGIFAANFLGTATVFVPVPGLTAAGQLLIVAGPRDLGLNPAGVVVAGAAGMALAESTAYLAGTVGRGVVEERHVPLKGRLGQWLRRAAAWIDWLMARYGFATLLTLSAVPNPLFEFAGVTAGAVRMSFWRFLLAVAIGKTMRVILLVVIGNAMLDAFDIG